MVWKMYLFQIQLLFFGYLYINLSEVIVGLVLCSICTAGVFEKLLATGTFEQSEGPDLVNL